MAAPMVYRWDDGNAPVARGERRSLCDILYACLVTGYGTKPGAGWTREYVNATFDKAAFRNNPVTGTGFFLQVDGYGAANAYSPTLKAFETMTSESDGLGPFGTTYGNSFQTSNGATTTARPWVLIADDRAFYLFIWVADTTTPNVGVQASTMFFGDLVRRLPADAYCCGLTSGAYGCAVGGMYNAGSTAGAGYNAIYIPRPASGVATPIMANHIRGGGPAADAGACGATGLAWSSGDQILIARPYVNDATTYSLRGWLPGHYYPCHPLAFGQLANISSDGKSFLSIRHPTQGGAHANTFISLDDWRTQ